MATSELTIEEAARLTPAGFSGLPQVQILQPQDHLRAECPGLLSAKCGVHFWPIPKISTGQRRSCLNEVSVCPHPCLLTMLLYALPPQA